MKKSIFLSLIFSCLLLAGALLSVIPYVVAAPIVIDIEKKVSPGLVSCGLVGSDQFCDMCDLIVLVKGALDFIWKGAWVIAAGMMVYGGFYMILPSFGAGGSGMYEKGKKILYNVGWGLLIVFFAWVIIDTIIKVVAGQSLTSGAPATLPQSTNTTTFNSQATPDFGDVPGPVTVPRFSISFGPWNKISCTRAPERAPLALLEIPEALRCDPKGPPQQIVGGFDRCAPLVAQAFRNDESVKGFASGQCSTSNITRLNAPNSLCGTESCASIIDRVAGAGSADAKLMRAIVLIESSGIPDRESPKGACGLAQVLPSSAPGKTCYDLFNPETSVREGLRIFQAFRSQTGGNLRRALIGYNGGNRALEPSNDCSNQVKGECITRPGGYAATINYFQKVESCLNSAL